MLSYMKSEYIKRRLAGLDILDVTGIVNFILGESSGLMYFYQADVDGNGMIDVNDVAFVVEMILEAS